MAELYANGRIVDLILLLLGLETVALLALWRLRSLGVPPLALILNLASGGALLLALRAALTDTPWYWVGICLTGALVAHLLDLRQRWTRGAVSATGLGDSGPGG